MSANEQKKQTSLKRGIPFPKKPAKFASAALFLSLLMPAASGAKGMPDDNRGKEQVSRQAQNNDPVPCAWPRTDCDAKWEHDKELERRQLLKARDIPLPSDRTLNYPDDVLSPRTVHERKIGQLIPGKGVYLGLWAPVGGDGKALGKVFNVYAAPHDLGFHENGSGSRLVLSYNDAVKAVGKTSLMGHKGAAYKDAAELYQALASDTYKGQWIIPPLDIVSGQIGSGSLSNDYETNNIDSFQQYMNTGKFAGTFDDKSRCGSEYWTSTPDKDDKTSINSFSVASGSAFHGVPKNPREDQYRKEYDDPAQYSYCVGKASTRLVRLEAAAEDDYYPYNIAPPGMTWQRGEGRHPGKDKLVPLSF